MVGIILYVSIAVGCYGFLKFISSVKSKYAWNKPWIHTVSISEDSDTLGIASTFWFIGIPIILASNVGTILAFFFVRAMDHDIKDRS